MKNAQRAENVTAVYAKTAHANTSITEPFVVNLGVQRAADQVGPDGRVVMFLMSLVGNPIMFVFRS